MATRKPLINYYEILGVPPDASPAEISAAYRAQTLRIRDIPGSGEETRRLNLAYRALSNADRRRDYDAALGGGVASAAHGEDATPFEAEPPPPEPATSHIGSSESSDAVHDEPPERPRRSLLLPAALAALLLLLAGLWAGGLFTDRPKLAEAPAADETQAGSANVASGESLAENDEGGSIADALAALLPGDTPPTVTSTMTSTSNVPAAGAATGDRPGDATATGTAEPAVPAPTEPADTAEAEPAEEEPAPERAPTAEPEAAPAPPPPAPPRIDRSSGPRLVSGGLVDADNRGGRFQGTVGVRLSVGSDGRPRSCRVTRSSGNAALDSTTCTLLEQRLQFTPARDADGNPTPSEVESVHVWGRRDR
jgi:protein TonB